MGSSHKGGKGPHTCSFIQLCQLYFNLQPHNFPNDGLKIQFVLMFLHEKAALWAQPIKQEIISPGGTTMTRSMVWTAFFDEFKSAFYDPDKKGSAMRSLTNLKQTKSANTYTSDFQQLITILGWTEEEQLWYHHYKGLKAEIKDKLAKVDAPTGLNDYIRLVEKIDNRIWTRKQKKKEEGGPAPQPTHTYRREPTPTALMLNITTNKPIPMDIGALSSEERQKRFKEGLCLYCGEKGHRKSKCPKLRKIGGVARATLIRATETEETESGKGQDS